MRRARPTSSSAGCCADRSNTVNAISGCSAARACAANVCSARVTNTQAPLSTASASSWRRKRRRSSELAWRSSGGQSDVVASTRYSTVSRSRWRHATVNQSASTAFTAPDTPPPPLPGPHRPRMAAAMMSLA